MKPFYIFLSILFILSYHSFGQTFDVDTILINGSSDKYINLVIMGDGYTENEQDKFIQDAKNLSNHIFSESPWSNYINYFNVFAIKVVSTESGAKHPNTAPDCNSASVPVSNPNTYFECSFDAYGIHRLVVPGNYSNVIKVLSTNFSNYDQVLIVSNSPYYGGSGGSFATSTLHASSAEISAHEIGHSFAFLADEYYAGDSYASEKANMTKETNPNLVKWKNWLGENGISINQHCCGGNSAMWYKPSTNCKMQALNNKFCSVCRQTILERIHSLVNPIVSYIPVNKLLELPDQYISFKLNELMKPIENTLKIDWHLDGINLKNNTDSLTLDQNSLSNGLHNLSVTVSDTNLLQRVDNHSSIHFSKIDWTINKKTTGTLLESTSNKIELKFSPNPAFDNINISAEFENLSTLKVQLFSQNGTLVKNLSSKNLEGRYNESFNISSIPAGLYFLVFTIDGLPYSYKLIKI